jgi:hypothetical protein
LRTANEETITEFKKMVVTIKDPVKRNQAMQDIQRFGKGTGFRIDKMSDGKSFRIDGKGADLNKFATDMKNYYGATVKAESLEEATPVPPRDLMLTYGKPGEKVKAYYTKFMQDLQNKASELRKKGFVVDKMGRTQPMSKLRDRIPEETDLKEARWKIEGSLGYKRISPRDDFDMVIDAPTERAAEDKAHDELDKARDKGKIGPGGGGSVEDVEFETVERTNNRLSAPETYRGGA